MRRILVIGCPGSGKTVFSEKLSVRTGYYLYHLDTIWHNPDRTHISREEFDGYLAQILATDVWIIDGHYSRSLETRLRVCDTVFFFDLPTEECIRGLTERLGQPRPEMPWIDTELDGVLVQEVRDFPTTRRIETYRLLEKYAAGREIHIFKSREEADRYFGPSSPVTLRPFQDGDMPLFRYWLMKDYIRKWYSPAENWIHELENRRGEFSFVHHFIAEAEDRIMGFAQYYDYARGGETWHGGTDITGTYSIDYLIGEEKFLGRHMAVLLIHALEEKIRTETSARRLIVRPEPENIASRKALLSAGYTYDHAHDCYFKAI